MSNLFAEELENTAITRIRKFATIANTLGFDIAVGFSGGKDSQVTYDLCKRAKIPFKAYYNVAFESPTTKKFIRENYPDVIWRRGAKTECVNPYVFGIAIDRAIKVLRKEVKNDKD